MSNTECQQMNFANLINRVGATRRRLTGASYSSRFHMPCIGFTVEVELFRSETVIYFEGELVGAGSAVQVPFKFSIPFAGMSTVCGVGVLSTPTLAKSQER